MQRAVELAKRGQYTTSPNPNVGCVLVKNNQVIGEGWHRKAGEGHAEVNAIANAKELGHDINGATAYVTLEPCSHFGRTPPCAQGLIDAGIKHVVIGMVDPNPLVSGRGVTMLQNAGISTESGVLESACRTLNPGFIKRMSQGKPLLRCKMAASLDGKTAMQSGESKWITGSKARQDVQRFRAKSCAIISGADTVLVDDATLNVRYQELGFAKDSIEQTNLRQPTRVIIDSQNRLTPVLLLTLALFKQQSSIILVRTSLEKTAEWPHFVSELNVSEINGKANLTELMSKLGEIGFNELWLESGARLSGAFIGAGLVDELILYQAPKLMAENSFGLFDIPTLTLLKDAVQLSFKDVRMVGDDLRIIADICS
ncbi:bifunctional diaminohydroxyphosphoribosylaminopyrimidine deaminase/5-amino-6-(5-phosphoribosylamino)uracil reductase RibD [Thalassotalea crassostreae]|uniref:bifunctional diaminohydroxyphosphoribosylaminopyrimidine deaminase/5-amino-6-(5-phosphoribosylamino)uracil reductase RibD n=1 Tax=Thalassotalea crassostreae TaxID=1763536 RepID=UPI0008388204|nr:bifunctional diaminohydroxyphosphoribosylaminopyrimidine deaminase/5-amino-6-(5-phosphoribosylamino)uracil reductase RibD [Thalassotalea crassostreae]